MAFITEVHERVASLAAVGCLDVDARELPAVVARLDDDDVRRVMTETAAAVNQLQRLGVIAAGVIAQRSARDRGHSGLAAVGGHRSATDLVQSLTGGTRADAARQVRVGVSIIDADRVDAERAGAGADTGAGAGADEPAGAPTGAPLDDPAGGPAGAPTGVPTGVPRAWDAPLGDALLGGVITAPQHDAIARALGAPPVVRDPATGGETFRAADDVTIAWGVAVEQLLDDAATFSPEDLAQRARSLRDALDPIGAEERAAARFEARSFRRWTDQNGTKRASIAFDDESAAWVDTVLDSALRPRRGGPRFVAEGEKAAASALADDPRTNDQLSFDLVIDLLRAGTVAQASDVFGVRQAGVRIITVATRDDDSPAVERLGPRDAFGRLLTTGHLEDGGSPVAGSVVDRAVCTHGYREIRTDTRGNPLDVGREKRLFTAQQSLALAMRDGGCRWAGCRAPASQCESHHIDHWSDGGRTDVDRGILLCRFHHMLLHDHGWTITRDGRGDFVLHSPRGEGRPIVLDTKSVVRWAWDPPGAARVGWRTPPPGPPPSSTPPSTPPSTAAPSTAAPSTAAPSATRGSSRPSPATPSRRRDHGLAT